MNIINIQNYNCSYNNNNILKDFNLSIKKGEFLCIVGENGSGKTSLMKCILNVNENSNSNGKIDKPRIIGYLPQTTEIQSNFPASVQEVVLSGTIINNPKKIFYTKKDKEKAENIIKKLNIENLKNKCFRELSGGQKQRVLLARALCSNSEVIILDEPVNGLDPTIVKQIYDLLLNLNKEGLTIIMVTHDIIRTKDYCSRVVEISNGNITYDDDPKKYEVRGDE